MRAGAARVLFALVVFTAGFGAACGEQATTTQSIGVGLRADPPAPPPAATPLVDAAVAAPAAQLDPTPSRAPRRASARRVPEATGRIVIPKIGIDLETYEGVDQWTLRFGPSWWEVTARPGDVGNTTFAGHRTTFTSPFYDIDRIAVGDEVTFATAAGVFTYRATSTFIVEETDVWIAEPTDTPTFTLFACHPKGSERQRYVVKGELVRAERVGSTNPSPPPEEERAPSGLRGCLLCRR